MFPLSTPTTSGLWADWLALLVVLAGLCAFALGISDLWRRLRPTSDLDRITLAAYGSLGLVGVSVAIMLAGGPAIAAAQAVFLVAAAWGVVRAGTSAPRAWQWWTSETPADLGRTAAFAAAACWSLWFWTGVFRDHVGLPAMTDGIVHTALYLRILQAGVPTLGRVPTGFAEIFGTQLFGFYPTGTHALMAVASGFWGQWGLVSHAGIIKAWFTLAMAASPFALFFVARRLMPRMPWWVGLALVFVAMPGFRFPIEAAHEGGASRLLAHVLMAPIYADVLVGRFEDLRWRPLAAVVLGLAFLMHPGAFVTLAALMAYTAMCSAASQARWRARLIGAAGLAAALAIGALCAMALLKWNAGVALARDAAGPFSWTALASRLQQGWTTLFDAEYGMAPVMPWLVAAGVALLAIRRKAFGLTWRVVGFPFWMALVAAVVLSAQVLPVPGLRLVGAAFFDEAPRVIELLYEALGLSLAALAWFAWSLAAGSDRIAGGQAAGSRREGDNRPPYRRFAAIAVAAGLVLATLGYQQARSPWLRQHFSYWDRQFRTSRISRLQALGAWIEQHTERSAILFYQPFDAEIWEAWTGRRGIFMYGECDVQDDPPPCHARKALVNGRLNALREALKHPTPAVRCLAEIDRFGRPGYFFLASPTASTEAFPVCSDATYLTTLDGHAVVAYRRP